MVFYAAFNNISVISQRQLTLFMFSWVSGWGSAVSCPRTLPRKNPEDPVRLEPRTPGLRVKHFTTEPRSTHFFFYTVLKSSQNMMVNDEIYNNSGRSYFDIRRNGGISNCFVLSNAREKSSKVCNIKVCIMKKYCILSFSANTWGQYQRIL